jgi:hypothetical protein
VSRREALEEGNGGRGEGASAEQNREGGIERTES